MNNLLIRIFLLSVGCFSFSVARAQTVDMEVKQGPNIDVVLTVGVTDQDIETFETDLDAALQSKGIPAGKLMVQGFERTTTSSNSEDAAAIFNNWTIWGYNSNTWEFLDSEKYIRRTENDFLSGYYDPVFDSSNYTLEAEIASTQGGDNDDMGITFGINGGPVGGYLFNLSGAVRPWTTANFVPSHGFATGLYQIVSSDGSSNPLHTIRGLQGAENTIFTPNDYSRWYKIKLEVKGRVAKIWVDNVLVVNYTAPTEITGSYGFFSNSQPYATFRNIEVTSLSLKKFKDVLREPQWRNSALRFNVNLDDQEVADFNDDSDLSEILMRTINEDIHYIGWGLDANKDQFERFTAQNNTKGTFINRSSGSYATWIDNMAQYIYDQYQFGTVTAGDFFIAGTSVEIAVSPTELKNNTANANYPSGRWKIAHDETHFPNNTGKVSWNNLYLEDVPEFYEKTGKYEFTFEDLPTAPTTLFFHRKPVASFVYSPGSGSITNTSYDLDGGANNGINQSEWKWKAVDAQTETPWTDGQFNAASVPDGEYLVMLRVQDYQGTWSKPTSVYVQKTSATAGTTDLPIAQFNILPDVLTTYSGNMNITINDNSSDPYGRTINNQEWIVTKRTFDAQGNPTDVEVHNSSTPLTDFSAYGNESAEYIISLRTQTDTGVWSLPFFRTLTIINDNTAPTITADVANGNLTTDDDVQLVFSDGAGGSGFDVQKFVLAQSATPPANDHPSWSSWSNSQAKTVSFSSGGTGWYIHTRARDNAGNEGTASFGPYALQLILAANDDLALLDEDTNSDPVDVLFNDNYDANNVPTVTIAVQGTKGVATVEPDNTITYVPNENENGTDRVTYQLDDNGTLATGQITFSIQAQDDLPIAVADTFALDENATLSEDVSTNDIEVDGDAREYTLIEGPLYASTFTFNTDGTFTYVHDGSEVATDSFTYNFEDANSFSETITATLNITLLNDVPVGGNATLEVVEDVPFTLSESDFVFTDADAGDAFNGIQVTSLPTNGTLWYNGNPVAENDLIDDVTQLTFTTATDGFGSNYADFGFRVKDGSDAVSVDSYSMSVSALQDLDGDGTPDTSDLDIDGDGTDNDEDAFPRDANEDTDTDGDGTGDNADTDDDNDGTPDSEDAFPKDENEDADNDGDGTGDNADLDDDNDGTPDSEDAFPFDENEDSDNDGDGTGDNADTDDDNDGTPDSEDAFPKDENEDADNDGDGTGDNADLDDDNDGTPDSQDAFPFDENEDADNDGDGTGDNADTDDDNDGTPDSQDAFPFDENEDADNDGDGTGDNADTDDDNDGTPDSEDAFPFDENEDADNDGDGTGDNADTDDDNDGTPDSQDAFPFDENEDSDNDGDGTGDNADTDDDNDGTPDSQDAFPFDENEDSDNDGDGTGDNADMDDDNDGTPDSEDAFPFDENEDTDTDGDGTGDNADEDADNDGIPDSEDAFPQDPNEYRDSDGDGLGDNADPDDDNDGMEDLDSDGDGTGDNADSDDDNDGVPDNEDAFPTDPMETMDTDNDGVGDNADEDDDNDGYSDVVENQHGTDSKSAKSTPKDTDGDGIPDAMDSDDDNDGVADSLDAFPEDDEPFLRPAEAFTPNGDGVNDTWVIPGLDNYPNARVQVYNRWGHEVFAAIDYRNDWNGNQNGNAKALPSGSYLYVIDLGNGMAPLRGWLFINY
ncbi:gliding motility-associated C-terminal domain-containing protein [Maribacter sp. 2307ULW6-5]|uniref:T9SS type B sorting domain-containing protein n=1 Tax=Maribacter sp. 2307ULW6-5 TaxID=3386275 RepID=UPI0039BD3CC2